MFRVGVIGLGNIGGMHLRNLMSGKVKNTKITAVCDIDQEQLYKYKDQLDADVQYFDNASSLFQSGCVDGVVIATPHYDHPELAIEAFQAGLHVFCEKPAGVYTKNVREMNEAAKKSGKAFQINFLMRTNQAYQKIKELIDTNELGKIKRIVWIITDWYRTQAYFNSGGWRATWAGEGGGTLLNQNPHQLDIFQWIGGMPKRVWSACYFGKNRDIEVEDEATGYFEYENGAVGLYMTSVSEFPGTNRLEIAGDRGKIVYENNQITFFRTTVGEAQFNAQTKGGFGPIPMWKCDIPFEGFDINAGHIKMMNNWVDAAEHGAELIAPGDEGINSLLLSNAMYLSAWKDDWVDTFFDEDEFFEKLQDKVQKSTFVKQEVVKLHTDMKETFHK